MDSWIRAVKCHLLSRRRGPYLYSYSLLRVWRSPTSWSRSWNTNGNWWYNQSDCCCYTHFNIYRYCQGKKADGWMGVQSLLDATVTVTWLWLDFYFFQKIDWASLSFPICDLTKFLAQLKKRFAFSIWYHFSLLLLRSAAIWFSHFYWILTDLFHTRCCVFINRLFAESAEWHRNNTIPWSIMSQNFKTSWRFFFKET